MCYVPPGMCYMQPGICLKCVTCCLACVTCSLACVSDMSAMHAGALLPASKRKKLHLLISLRNFFCSLWSAFRLCMHHVQSVMLPIMQHQIMPQVQPCTMFTTYAECTTLHYVQSVMLISDTAHARVTTLHSGLTTAGHTSMCHINTVCN